MRLLVARMLAAPVLPLAAQPTDTVYAAQRPSLMGITIGFRLR